MKQTHLAIFASLQPKGKGKKQRKFITQFIPKTIIDFVTLVTEYFLY